MAKLRGALHRVMGSLDVKKSIFQIVFGALVAVFFAYMQWIFWHWLAPSRFILFYPAVVIASMLGGLYAGITATVLASFLAFYAFFQPVLTFRLDVPQDVIPILIFLCVGISISIMSDILKKTNREFATQRTQRKSDLRFRQIFDSSPTALLSLIDKGGTILLVNALVSKVFAYEPDELVGQKVEVLIPERFRAGHLDLRENYMQHPKPRQMGVGRRLFGRRKDGAEIPVEVALTPIEMDDGIAILTTVIDTSERMRTEAELKNRLTELLIKDWSITSALSAISTADLAGNVTYANPAYLRMWGYDSLQEVVGKRMEDFWQNPEQAAETIEMIKTRGKCRGEFVGKRNDGTCFDFELLVNLVTSPIGEPVCMQGSFLDISERKQNEEVLRRSEERYRSLFNNAEVGIFISKLDGSEVLEANSKFLDIVGMTKEETLGKPSVILWADAKGREEMVKRLEADGFVSAFEYKMWNRRQGEVKNCLTSLRLYRKQGILEGSILDITDRKRNEKALREAKEAAENAVRIKSRFLDIAAHELRTPVTAFSLLLQFAQMQLEKNGRPVPPISGKMSPLNC